ncbi:MAG: hypothetical protein PHN44_11840, partial [Candidatus Marinimicrobia bacterium]|nr:hypothetical protein [Candidatus Neomarinimicrobiota bacterium]
MKINETRLYPLCCTSAYCGRVNCDAYAHRGRQIPECQNKPVLERFRTWVEKTDAIIEDPIWCPRVYTA